MSKRTKTKTKEERLNPELINHAGLELKTTEALNRLDTMKIGGKNGNKRTVRELSEL